MSSSTRLVLVDVVPRLEACRREIDDARHRLDLARQRRDQLVVDAAARGYSHRLIAAAAGVSRPRIIAILGRPSGQAPATPPAP